MLAGHLTPEELAAAREQFVLMDRGARGYLSSGDVEALILESAQGKDVTCLLAMARCQSFTYSEFLAAMASAKIDPSSESIAAAFHRFAGPNGVLDENSLQAMISDTQGAGVEFLPQASGCLDFKGFTEYLARARSASQSTARGLCSHFHGSRPSQGFCGEVASLHTSKAVEEIHVFMEELQLPHAAKSFRTYVHEGSGHRSCMGLDVGDACSIQ